MKYFRLGREITRGQLPSNKARKVYTQSAPLVLGCGFFLLHYCCGFWTFAFAFHILLRWWTGCFVIYRRHVMWNSLIQTYCIVTREFKGLNLICLKYQSKQWFWYRGMQLWEELWTVSRQLRLLLADAVRLKEHSILQHQVQNVMYVQSKNKNKTFLE